MAGVEHGVDVALRPYLGAEGVEDGAEFVVDDMFFAFVDAAAISAQCVVRHQSLVPAVVLVAREILVGLSVAREMNVHHVAGTALGHKASECLPRIGRRGLAVGEGCDCKSLAAQCAFDEADVVGAVNRSPTQLFGLMLRIVRNAYQQRALLRGMCRAHANEGHNYRCQQSFHAAKVQKKFVIA